MNKRLPGRLLLGALWSLAPLLADVPSFDYLFSRPYVGLLPYQPAEGVPAYRAPRLDAPLPRPVDLAGGCIHGGGGDCQWGTLFRQKARDGRGHTFYLVEDREGRDAWILAGKGVKAEALEIRPGMGGEEITFREGEDQPEPEGGALFPLAGRRRSVLSRLRSAVAPQAGELALSIHEEALDRPLALWPSFDRSEAARVTLKVREFLATFPREEGPAAPLKLQVLRRDGDRFLVMAQGEGPDLPSRWESCGESARTFFWLDAGGLPFVFQPEVVRAGEVPGPPALVLQEAYGVQAVRGRGRRRTALVEKGLTVPDPLRRDASLGEGRVAILGFRLPMGWHRIRDARGRLRFWFASVSC